MSFLACPVNTVDVSWDSNIVRRMAGQFLAKNIPKIQNLKWIVKLRIYLVRTFIAQSLFYVCQNRISGKTL